jgi:phosphosulfolactate synthase
MKDHDQTGARNDPSTLDSLFLLPHAGPSGQAAHARPVDDDRLGGLGTARQADTLNSAGHYVDFAKIAAGIARFLPRDVLAEKLALYTSHGISASPGGLFAELALSSGRYEDFVSEALEVGFTGLEVSDNLLDLSPRDKAYAIAHARKEGLKVFGEVGKKHAVQDDDAFVADVANCLEAGADWVFLEAAELFVDRVPRLELIQRLRHEFDPERLIYELPVVILPGITRDFKHEMTAWMVREMGTEVNLANIEWDELYTTELVRRGFAGDTSHPDGAYARAGFAPEGTGGGHRPQHADR